MFAAKETKDDKGKAAKGKCEETAEAVPVALKKKEAKKKTSKAGKGKKSGGAKGKHVKDKVRRKWKKLASPKEEDGVTVVTPIDFESVAYTLYPKDPDKISADTSRRFVTFQKVLTDCPEALPAFDQAFDPSKYYCYTITTGRAGTQKIQVPRSDFPPNFFKLPPQA